MDPYNTFIQLANQITSQALTQIDSNATPFQRSYYQCLIRDVEKAKRTISLHQDIVQGIDPKPFNTD